LKNAHTLNDFFAYAKDKLDCLTNEQILGFQKEDVDVDKVLDNLISKLSALESGSSKANEYHKLMTSILKRRSMTGFGKYFLKNSGKLSLHSL